jgi:chromosome segregation ATPase
MEKEIKGLREKNMILKENMGKVGEEGNNIKKLLKEKNKEVRDGKEHNSLLRKDLDILNDKLREVINENESIKKLNKNLLKDKTELEDELNKAKAKIEELKITSAKFENENKFLNTEIKNVQYDNKANEKKLKVSNCEIQELDKTLKYLKKDMEQKNLMKCTNKCYHYRNCNYQNCKKVCLLCGCETKIYNNDNYISYNGKEYDVIKLIEDNKTLYRNNKELKNKINKMAHNLDVYINDKKISG